MDRDHDVPELTVRDNAYNDDDSSNDEEEELEEDDDECGEKEDEVLNEIQQVLEVNSNNYHDHLEDSFDPIQVGSTWV